MSEVEAYRLIHIMSGMFIGPYRVERRITAGGMAELFFARLPAGTIGVERPAVIKALMPGLVRNEQWRSMFHHEARVAALLDHPNLVRFLDLHVQNDRPYIVLEYLQGRNLLQLFRRAMERRVPVRLGVICRVIADVLAGLGYMHEHVDADGHPTPLIHRDVSPSNIMCTFAGTVKVVDFGIAKSLQPSSRAELTAAGQFKGKCGYSAPEQVCRNAVDARSDVFSTGIVLWELLTGRRLFGRRSELETLRAVVSSPIPAVTTLAPDVPPKLAAVCARALERDPKRRYASSRAMRTDLESIILVERWEANALALERLMGQLFDDQERDAGIVSLGDEAPPTQVDAAPPIALRLASTATSDAPEAATPKREGQRLVAVLVMLMAFLSVLGMTARGLRSRGHATTPASGLNAVPPRCPP
jgi:serine/threonine-protein kinase